jgi:hypothetical protein
MFMDGVIDNFIINLGDTDSSGGGSDTEEVKLRVYRPDLFPL